MKSIIIAVVLITLGVIGWFLFSPLFIDKVVDESLNDVYQLPTHNEIRAMDLDERDIAHRNMLEWASNQPDTAKDEPMPSEPVLIAEGHFVGADAIHSGTGSASIYRLGDGSHVLRFEDFRVTNGPALNVQVVPIADPLNADSYHYSELGMLKGNVGNQNYPLWETFSLDQARSVLIWCGLFNVPFAVAELSPVSADS